MIGQWTDGFGLRLGKINPAFPLSQVAALTDPRLIDTLLPTFEAVKSKNVTNFSNCNNSISIANSFNYTAPDDESKILAWLSPLEPWVRHRDIGAGRVDGIGAWLLESCEVGWQGGSGTGKRP